MRVNAQKPLSYLVLTVILGLLTIGVPTLIFQQVKGWIYSDTLNSLKGVLDTAEQSVLLWQAEEKATIQAWSKHNEILLSATKALLSTAWTPKNLKGHPATSALRTRLTPIIEQKRYKGFLIIAPDGTTISSMQDATLGQKSRWAQSDHVFARTFQGETVISLPRESEVPTYGPDGNPIDDSPTMFVATPIRDANQKIIATLAFRLDPGINFSRLLHFGRIGNSGETYAFNRAGLLISEIRFEDQAREIGLIGAGQTGILNISIRDPGVNLLDRNTSQTPTAREHRPLTRMAKQAIAGIDGHDLDGYRDYRGVSVIGIWRWHDTAGFGLTTEINTDEAFRTLDTIKYAIIMGASVNILLLISLIAVFIDRNRTVQRQSLEDPLTGLANRRMLDIKLNMEFANAIRQNTPLSICMIDIDHFKRFNDRHGHVAGDLALQRVAQALKSTIKRETDLAARYGGEEFCVVLPNTPLKNAADIAESLRSAVSAVVIAEAVRSAPSHDDIARPKGADPAFVTISIGVAQLSKDTIKNPKDLIDRADQALYRAKSEGRDRVHVDEAPMDAPPSDR